jgi:hypothetical protein
MQTADHYADIWVDVCFVVMPCATEFPLAPTRGLCHAPTRPSLFFCSSHPLGQLFPLRPPPVAQCLHGRWAPFRHVAGVLCFLAQLRCTCRRQAASISSGRCRLGQRVAQRALAVRAHCVSAVPPHWFSQLPALAPQFNLLMMSPIS